MAGFTIRLGSDPEEGRAVTARRRGATLRRVAQQLPAGEGRPLKRVAPAPRREAGAGAYGGGCRGTGPPPRLCPCVVGDARTVKLRGVPTQGCKPAVAGGAFFQIFFRARSRRASAASARPASSSGITKKNKR